MKFWKKTVTLRLPLWGVVAAVLVPVVLAGVLLVGQTNFRENLLLQTLVPDNVSSAHIYDSECMTVHRNELSREDIAAVAEVINKVRLPGKPYEFDAVGGGPRVYEFILNDGSVFRFGCQLVSKSYYYWMNERYYYICCDGDETDLSAFTQLEGLHRQQSEVYFK